MMEEKTKTMKYTTALLLAALMALASCKGDGGQERAAEAPPPAEQPAPPSPAEGSPATAGEQPSYEFPDIEGKTWVLTKYQYQGRQERILGGAAIELSIRGDQLTGNGGCNAMSGRIGLKGDGAVDISGISRTEKLCRGLMTQETRVIELLEGAETYKVNLVFLEFNGPQGQLLFRNDLK